MAGGTFVKEIGAAGVVSDGVVVVVKADEVPNDSVGWPKLGRVGALVVTPEAVLPEPKPKLTVEGAVGAGPAAAGTLVAAAGTGAVPKLKSDPGFVAGVAAVKDNWGAADGAGTGPEPPPNEKPSPDPTYRYASIILTCHIPHM